MSADRARQLDSLGFRWGKVWEENWNDRYEELRRYRAAHGHCLVPTHAAGPHKPLATWVIRQRERYKARGEEGLRAATRDGKKRRHFTAMTDEQIRKLEDIGFQWKVGTGRGPAARAQLDGQDPAPW